LTVATVTEAEVFAGARFRPDTFEPV